MTRHEKHHGELDLIQARDGKLKLEGKDSARTQVFEVDDYETYAQLMSIITRLPEDY